MRGPRAQGGALGPRTCQGVAVKAKGRPAGADRPHLMPDRRAYWVTTSSMRRLVWLAPAVASRGRLSPKPMARSCAGFTPWLTR